MIELLPNLLEYGPFAALTFALVYYMRKDHRKDYEGVTTRLNDVEDYQKNKLTDTLTDNSRVVAENTKTMQDVRQVIEKCKARN
jgi:hypothetical protein